MAASNQVIAASGQIHKHTFDTLRAQFPFLNEGTLQQLATHVETTVQYCLQAQEPLMEASKASFDFFKLSAELRNKIYEHVLFDDIEEEPKLSPIDVCQKTGLVDTLGSKIHVRMIRQHKYDEGTLQLTHAFRWPALLQVNKQIREEATPMFLSQTVFTTDFGLSGLPQLKWPHGRLTRWLETLGPDRVKFIKKLVVRIGLKDTAGMDDVATACFSLESGYDKYNFLKGFLFSTNEVPREVFGVPQEVFELRCDDDGRGYSMLEDDGTWVKVCYPENRTREISVSSNGQTFPVEQRLGRRD